MKQPSSDLRAPDLRDIDRLQGIVARHWGLDVPAERWRYVRDRIRRLLEGNHGEWDWFHELAWDEHHMVSLAPLITVGETYFFRDTGLFETLEAEILPALIASARSAGRTLAVGSAGCSTGEEIYSVAILLRRLLPEHESRSATLLGVDINQEAVEKARSGRYGVWSFRETPERWKAGRFTPLSDGCFQLCEEIRRMVRFRVANLASTDHFPFAPGSFDLLLCRNVLMYFHRDVSPLVIDRLARALRPGGILVLAPPESHLGHHASLELKQIESTWIFVKRAVPVADAAGTGSESSRIVDAPGPAPDPSANAVDFAAYPAGPVTSSLKPDREERPVEEKISLEAAIRQAQEYADRRQLPRAREWAERALQIAPVQSSTHLLLGVILHDQGDLTGAREAFKRATFLAPDSVLAHFHLGMIALQVQQVQEARTALQRTLDLLQAAPRVGLELYQGSSARELQRMVHIMMEQIHG